MIAPLLIALVIGGGIGSGPVWGIQEPSTVASRPNGPLQGRVAVDQSGSPEKYKVVKTADVVFRRGADYQLKCDIYVPAGDGPFPAVLAVHGGAWRFGSKWQLLRQARRLCQAGYVVVSIDYRLAPRWPFPNQVADCFAALEWIHAHATEYSIDPDQIFGYGYSAGGHLVSLIATTRPEDWPDLDWQPQAPQSVPRFQAVAVGGTPFDFGWVPPRSTTLQYWLGGTRRDAPEVYRRASPVAHLDHTDPPFFIFQANDDTLVPVRSSREMVRQLEELGIEHEYRTLGSGGHLGAFNDADTLEALVSYFDRHVLKRTPSSPPANR